MCQLKWKICKKMVRKFLLTGGNFADSCLPQISQWRRVRETDWRFWLCRGTRGLGFLSMTCFWRELALGVFVNRTFSSVSSWGTLESEHTQEQAAVENVTKFYKHLWGSNRNVRGEHYSTCIHRKTIIWIQVKGIGKCFLANLCMTETLLPPASYAPAVRDLHSCHRMLPRDCGQVHYLHQFSILSFNANPPLPTADEKAMYLRQNKEPGQQCPQQWQLESALLTVRLNIQDN